MQRKRSGQGGSGGVSGEPGTEARAGELEIERQLDGMERRFAELTRQVQRLQRYAAMGTMSAMLAHEFKNLLTPVLSYAQYALKRGDPELMRTGLETARRNAESAAVLCDRIMAMAAGDAAGAGVANVRAAVDDALACLGRGLDRDGITVRVEVDEGLAVRSDPAHLQQVLFNLVLNARQAMLGHGGYLTITARADADGVLLAVADTGEGIRATDLPRVFEPFFSTRQRADRPDQRGTGLGLTICRQLIEEAGGRIDVASRWGEGATFTLRLPAASTAAGPAA